MVVMCEESGKGKKGPTTWRRGENNGEEARERKRRLSWNVSRLIKNGC